MILPRRDFITWLIACGAVLSPKEFPRSKSGRRYHSPHIFKIGILPCLAVEFTDDGIKPVDDPPCPASASGLRPDKPASAPLRGEERREMSRNGPDLQ